MYFFFCQTACNYFPIIDGSVLSRMTFSYVAANFFFVCQKSKQNGQDGGPKLAPSLSLGPSDIYQEKKGERRQKMCQ